jgi:septation ring formation regulator
MHLDKLLLFAICYSLVAIIIIFVTLKLMKSKKIKELNKCLEELDIQKNEIESAPVISELAKLETIVKNEKMEKKYKTWYEDFEKIREEDIPKINDMIIDLETYLENKEYKDYKIGVAKTEIEIYKAKTKIDNLMDEIKEINLSSEKYRNIIIKLKSKYRDLETTFRSKEDEYEDIANVISLQLENIERRFQDFEEYMEVNDYQEVFHIVKAIDNMIEHMEIVINEVPDLVLLSNRLIPKKIEQITEIYDEMKKEKYPLKHLKIEYNVEESLKKVNEIIDRIKVLNLENCMFELKNMLEFLENLFQEFDIEKNGRKDYEEDKAIFESRMDKLSTKVNEINDGIDLIKKSYDLKEEDITSLTNLKEKLDTLNDTYKKDVKELGKKKLTYSIISDNLKGYLVDLKSLEDEMEEVSGKLGNMHDDEERAREQLNEIQELLRESKLLIRKYKLPIVSDNYFVELSEANEAIVEIIRELEKKPISIGTLNTRVDTARDLALKLFNTTNEMVKLAKLAEYSIVYGNRYRSENINIDSGLNQATMLFNKGNYKKSLDVTMNTLERVDGSIRGRINEVYENSR